MTTLKQRSEAAKHAGLFRLLQEKKEEIEKAADSGKTQLAVVLDSREYKDITYFYCTNVEHPEFGLLRVSYLFDDSLLIEWDFEE